MDREAAVIRSEMNQTRLDLDSKLAQLETRARELTPRRYLQRHMPDRLLDRVIGGVLTLTGVAMAWHRLRLRERRRVRVRAAMASYGR
jgi:hypothetical protein